LNLWHKLFQSEEISVRLMWAKKRVVEGH
jgi:hypothetical protein